jgi:hypothetical protein
MLLVVAGSILLRFKMRMTGIPSAGWVGCALTFLALLQGWLLSGLVYLANVLKIE